MTVLNARCGLGGCEHRGVGLDSDYVPRNTAPGAHRKAGAAAEIDDELRLCCPRIAGEQLQQRPRRLRAVLVVAVGEPRALVAGARDQLLRELRHAARLLKDRRAVLSSP